MHKNEIVLNIYTCVQNTKTQNLENVYTAWSASNSNGIFSLNKVTRLVTFEVSTNNEGIDNGVTIATLDTTYRPVSAIELYSICRQTSGFGRFVLRINTDGRVVMNSIDYDEPIQLASVSGMYIVT